MRCAKPRHRDTISMDSRIEKNDVNTYFSSAIPIGGRAPIGMQSNTMKSLFPEEYNYPQIRSMKEV